MACTMYGALYIVCQYVTHLSGDKFMYSQSLELGSHLIESCTWLRPQYQIFKRYERFTGLSS